MTSANGKIVSQLESENDLESVAFSNSQLGYFALGKHTLTIIIL